MMNKSYSLHKNFVLTEIADIYPAIGIDPEMMRITLMTYVASQIIKIVFTFILGQLFIQNSL